MAGLPELLLLVLKHLHDGFARRRLHFAEHLIARLGYVGLRLECLAIQLAFLIRAFFKGEPPLDLGAEHLHLPLREKFSSYLLPGGAPIGPRALNIVRKDLLEIAIGAARVSRIDDQVHSVALSEAQQALADDMGLLGCSCSPRTQILLNDGWVLLNFLVCIVQR